MASACLGGSPVLLLQFGVGLALVVGVVSYPSFLLLSILCYLKGLDPVILVMCEGCCLRKAANMEWSHLPCRRCYCSEDPWVVQAACLVLMLLEQTRLPILQFVPHLSCRKAAL